MKQPQRPALPWPPRHGGPTALSQCWVSAVPLSSPAPAAAAGAGRVNQQAALLPTVLPRAHPSGTDTDSAVAQQPHPQPYSLAIP